MKFYIKLWGVFVLFSLAVFAAEQNNPFNSKIIFVEPVLEFMDYAEFNENLINLKLQEVQFNGVFNDVKISNKLGNDYLKINLNISKDYQVVEEYYYHQHKISNIEIHVGEFNRRFSDFRGVKFDKGIKFACKVSDYLDKKLIRENHVLGKSYINPEKINKILPLRDFNDDLRITNNHEEVKGEIYGNSYLHEKWLNLLETLYNKKVVLYGIWKSEMIDYVFDGETCVLGIFRGRCSNILFNEKNNRGNFVFENEKDNSRTVFEYMKNEYNFFLRPRGGQWTRLTPFCAKGSYPRIQSDQQISVKYKCDG